VVVSGHDRVIDALERGAYTLGVPGAVQVGKVGRLVDLDHEVFHREHRPSAAPERGHGQPNGPAHALPAARVHPGGQQRSGRRPERAVHPFRVHAGWSPLLLLLFLAVVGGWAEGRRQSN